MFHDAQTIHIDGTLQSDREKGKSGWSRQIVQTLTGVFSVKPSDAEIAARRKYERSLEFAYKKVEQAAPAYVRQQIHFY